MYNQCDVSRLGRRKKKLRNHKKHWIIWYYKK
jgi:hypothetical protein